MSDCARGVFFTICGSFGAFCTNVETNHSATVQGMFLQSEFEAVRKYCVTCFSISLSSTVCSGSFHFIVKGWSFSLMWLVAPVTYQNGDIVILWIVACILCFKQILNCVLSFGLFQVKKRGDIWKRHLEVQTVIFSIYWCFIGWMIYRSLKKIIPITVNCSLTWISKIYITKWKWLCTLWTPITALTDLKPFKVVYYYR